MFHPVIKLEPGYAVLDLSVHLPDEEVARHRFAVGRYDEKRIGTYTAPHFEGIRNVHMGIDLFAPFGTPVMAFAPGEIHAFGCNARSGDYGNVIVTRHLLGGIALFALHGHLSARSIAGIRRGTKLKAGDVLGWVGDRTENGDWVPHLHFQLSHRAPDGHDLPGVVSEADRGWARLVFPDPRIVLGPLY